MKRNLLIGIIGGAAIGAAASYLLEGENRRGLVSGLSNRFNNLVGGSEEESELLSGGSEGSASSSSSSNGNRGGGSKRKGSSGRRG
jgi:hypothetical protein